MKRLVRNYRLRYRFVLYRVALTRFVILFPGSFRSGFDATSSCNLDMDKISFYRASCSNFPKASKGLYNLGAISSLDVDEVCTLRYSFVGT